MQYFPQQNTLLLSTKMKQKTVLKTLFLYLHLGPFHKIFFPKKETFVSDESTKTFFLFLVPLQRLVIYSQTPSICQGAPNLIFRNFLIEFAFCFSHPNCRPFKSIMRNCITYHKILPPCILRGRLRGFWMALMDSTQAF